MLSDIELAQQIRETVAAARSRPVQEFDPGRVRPGAPVDFTAELARVAPFLKVVERRRPAVAVDTTTGEVQDREVRPLVQVTSTDHHQDVTPDQQQTRARAYALQTEAARLAPGRRVALCHRLPSGGKVEIRRAGRAYLNGVQTCGSVWDCPVCSRKITEGRRAEVQQIASVVRAWGGDFLMLTLTAPHGRLDPLADSADSDGVKQLGLKSKMLQAYRYLGSGKNSLPRLVSRAMWGAAWDKKRPTAGFLGTVRGLEVTHGENGWHVHFHAVLAVGQPLDPAQLDHLEEMIYGRWCAAAARVGLGQPSRAHGVDLQVAKVAGDVDPVTDYVCKWGVAEELAKLHTKESKAGRSPWQLLQASTEGDHHAGALWRDYSRAFHGARQLVIGSELRMLAGLKTELSDEELAAGPDVPGEPETHELVTTLEPLEWVAVRAFGRRSDLLDLAERGVTPLAEYLTRCVSEYLSRGGMSPAERGRARDRVREFYEVLYGGGD